MSLKNKINIIFQKITGYKLIHRDMDIHLQLLFDQKYGHRKSRETKQSIDELGNPIPWITYPALEYIDQLDLTDKDIFEWGSGNSSLYFAKRCNKIISIETDKEWYDQVVKNIKPNMNIVFSNAKDAAQKINTFDQKFDVIFIDSATNRKSCAIESLKHLNKGGMIILDNSDRFQNASKVLKNENFIQIDMHGIGPINKYSSTTSLFIDRTYNFKSLIEMQPSFSKAALQDFDE